MTQKLMIKILISRKKKLDDDDISINKMYEYSDDIKFNIKPITYMMI